MSEILAFAEASASDPKLSADPVPDTEAGHTTTDTLKTPSASSEKEATAPKSAPDSDTGSVISDSESDSSEKSAPDNSGSDEFDTEDFTSESFDSSDDSEKDPFTGEKKSSRRIFHTAKELNYLREKYILEKIPDDQLLEYLKLEEKRHELQVQERNIREKRIMNAFMLTVILAAIVAVVYSLHENPTVLISILYIGGILAGVHVWNKKK